MIAQYNKTFKLLGFTPLLLAPLFFALFLLSATFTYAQNTNSPEPKKGESIAPSASLLPDQGPMLSDQTSIKKGQWSFSFSVPYGGAAQQGFADQVPHLGFWRMLSDDFALGIFTGLRISAQDIVEDEEAPNYTSGEQLVSSELVLSPSFKFYPYQKDTVALYFIGQAHVRMYSDGDKATTTDTEPSVGETYSPNEELQFRTRFGFGTEWFPTPAFSIAGHVGLQLDLLRQGDLGFGLETFTSALSAQVYF